MESRPEGGNDVESNVQGGFPSTIGSQPWWRGPGFGAMSPVVLPEGTARPPSVELPVRSGGMKGGQLQLHDGVGDMCQASKEMQNMGVQAVSDGSYGQGHQQLQTVSSALPPMMPEYLAPRVQMELGQSVACAAYTYSDPYYAGLMSAYGNQALVHPQLPGMPHTRMPLPLEMTEEPVYVNAKQYHGILRRRQSRAKLELEKKLIKARKPYLHESRHQHAMRRARGCGGRFLNTKKADANAGNSDADKGANSACTKLEVGRPGMQGMFEPHAHTISNDDYEEQSGFHLSAFRTKPGEEGDCLGQQRGGGIMVSRPQNRAVAIK